MRRITILATVKRADGTEEHVEAYIEALGDGKGRVTFEEGFVLGPQEEVIIDMSLLRNPE